MSINEIFSFNNTTKRYREEIMSAGYIGKYCIVDLTNRKTEAIEPGDAFYRKYLSGYGLGAAVITMRQKAGVDPLSPDSYLGFCSGLLTDTGAFFSGRFMVVGKSPLTGGWGDANCGGFFSQKLKRAGYDAVFFTGKSDNPVYVIIGENEISFKDARSLWGKDAVETEELIKEELGDKKIQVACIGMSGEKLSLISGIVNDAGRIAARSGLGAVMGSKNLKAVVATGNIKTAVHDADAMKTINKNYLKEYKKSKAQDRLTVKIMNFLSQVIARTGVAVPAEPSLVREVYKKYGTSGLTVYSAMTGDMPIKNWGGVGFTDYTIESAAKNSDEAVVAYQKKRYACQACPLGCGGIIDIKKGKYQGTEGHKPEYETLGAFGGLLLHDDLDTIIEINELCNRAGIDTISTGGAVAYAIECFENGILTESDTDGLALKWGDTSSILKLTEMIIERKGIGDLLADGVKVAAAKIGKGSEQYAIHAGGQELPMHDSRLDQGFAIAYQHEPTPGRHTISSYLYSGVFGTKKKFPAAKKMYKSGKGKDAKKIRLYAATSFYTQIINGSGVCIFGALTSNYPMVEYLNAATGWNLDADDYLKIGERILNIRKAFNVREGILVEDQKLSGRPLGNPPLPKGPIKGITVDNEKLTGELFAITGWDRITGGPTPEKMKELQIDDLFS